MRIRVGDLVYANRSYTGPHRLYNWAAVPEDHPFRVTGRNRHLVTFLGTDNKTITCSKHAVYTAEEYAARFLVA